MVLCWVKELIYIESMSPSFPTHFHVDIYSFAQHVEVTQLVSGFLSEGIALCVCLWEEGCLGDSYVTILVSPKFVYFLSIV